MVNIAVIGAGKLGSHHLEALSMLDRLACIEVVEPNYNARIRAKKLFDQVIGESNNIYKIEFFENISDLSNYLDVVIVATNSDVRRMVVEELLSQKKVTYLILEKVLFQKLQDFEFCNRLFAEKKVLAWVNCPRRIWSFYQDIKDKLVNEKYIDFNVTGSKWGIGCNSIHFLDLFSYLIGETNIELCSDHLDNNFIPSKRPGFIEFTGTLFGKASEEKHIMMTSYKEGNIPLLIHITSESISCLIRKSEGKAWISERKNNWNWQEVSFSVPFQSQLTHLVVEQILDEGRCNLTNFTESSRIHGILLKALLNHMKKVNKEDFSLCPIT